MHDNSLFSMQYISLKVKNILLHDAGTAAVSPEHIFYDCFAETVFGDAAVFFSVKILLHQDFFDPCIHRKRVYVVKAEKTHTVGYLFSDSVKSGELFHGALIVQSTQMGQLQPAGNRVLAEPVDVLGPVAQLKPH